MKFKHIHGMDVEVEVEVVHLPIPAGRYDYGDEDELSDSEISEILCSASGKDHGVPQELIYWYGTGDYEGDGAVLVLLEGGGVCNGDLGHCSCYGPGECDLSYRAGLDEFEKSCTEDALKDFGPLIEAARR